MQFVRPIPFREAVQKLGQRTVVGSGLDTAGWRSVPLAIRERSLWSSKIEDTRFLQSVHDALTDFLTGARETITLPDGTTTTALKVGSKADFVRQLRPLAQRYGLDQLVDPDDRGGLKDITSQRRLELIFDTQTQMANSYGDWLQGMNPDVLDEFPAWRFIREVDVRTPRPIHQQNEGVVRLKTDQEFWLAMNSPQIGGFGVPWGPWGFNSGMGVEDVDRSEAESLGLLAAGEGVEPTVQKFNDHLQASVRDLDPNLQDWLRRQFGARIEIHDGTATWKGDTDESSSQNLRSPSADDRPSGRVDYSSPDVRRRIAEAGRAVFAGLRSRDHGVPFDSADAEAGGAHLLAVSEGRKPLYHEQLDPATANGLIRSIWGLPLGPEIEANLDSDGHVYVWNPAAAAAVIARDPGRYPGVDQFDRIRRASHDGYNGDLLGYGAPSLLEAEVLVRIVSPKGEEVFGFRSMAAAAEEAGRARAGDFTRAYGGAYSYAIADLQ